ncbi:hypothetical protein [Alteromonas sp. C1M14]|uniref:hypothetical protein n=1 Tax=Alteromonas sp. C1M14 TaxID=2841567 RepID=UPI001C0A65E9|nr:hypothetical protein [Alteromonas sp. C1M14]MBU2978119.1 hypothetical protein [Alteromonas sp. C1M14]
MTRITFLTVLIAALTGCSPRPSSDELTAHFRENRSTFSMLATLACRVGNAQDEDVYHIGTGSQNEKAILALADTVDIDGINYRTVEGRCTLKMPVWYDEDGDTRMLISYRFNDPLQTQSNNIDQSHPESIDEFIEISQQQQMSENKLVTPLSKHWNYSVSYKKSV